MDEETKDIIDAIIKFASVVELKSTLVVNPQDDLFVGINIRFSDPIKLSEFPNLKKAVEDKR